MVTDSYAITKYMNDVIRIKYGEVFILLERKADAREEEKKTYNYYCKGNSLDMLMCLGELVERISKQMGLTFDETVEVLKNVHLQDKTIIRTRNEKRISKDWMVIE